MIDEVTDHGATEIHADPPCSGNVALSPSRARHVEGVVELLLLFRHRLSIHFQQQEVNLVHMEFVQLSGTVLDRPVLNCSLRCHDCRRLLGS